MNDRMARLRDGPGGDHRGELPWAEGHPWARASSACTAMTWEHRTTTTRPVIDTRRSASPLREVFIV